MTEGTRPMDSQSLMNEWGGRQVSDGSALGWGMSALGTLEPTPFSHSLLRCEYT